MIAVIVYPKWSDVIDMSTYNKAHTTRKPNWGHKKGGSKGMKQVADWKSNPLGRHPFNIITEEIYND